MTKRYTAAHWGTYEIKGTGDAVRLDPVKDDPNPSAIAEGWLDAAQDRKTRVLKPSIRKGWFNHRDRTRCCNDSYVEVEWDVALDLVADELERVRHDHGNASIFAGSYGWASTGRFHHAQSQMRRFLNTIGGFSYSRDTYSHAAAEVLLPHITGMSHRSFLDNTTDLAVVAATTELLVCFGGISGRTAQIASSGVSRHETEHWLAQGHTRGMQVVSVSPQRGDFDADLDPEWLSLRPNTDTALMLGLAYELHRLELHDLDFLHRCCHGWPQFEGYLTGAADGIPKTATWAADICDLLADQITALAKRMASQRTMISVAWGIQRSDHGEQPVWMGLTLAAMLGQLGKAGGGFGFGYGSTDVVGKSSHLAAWPSVPQGQNPVADFIPVAHITKMLNDPGGTFVYDGVTRQFPDARIVYWVGGNPFHHHQDLFELDRAWTAPETIIVHEPWWTATAKRADIVLPSTTTLERRDLMMNRRDNGLAFMDRAIAPVGMARDDFDIFAQLAQRFGTQDIFTQGRDTEGWIAHLWTQARSIAQKAGHVLPDFSDFQPQGMVSLPNKTMPTILFEAFVQDPVAHPLNTSTGKIEIVSPDIAAFNLPDCPDHPVWIEPTEWLGAQDAGQDALHLISGQPQGKLHSQLDAGSQSKSHKRRGREQASLHPATAAARDIKDGDLILLSNPRGACLAVAKLTDSIRQDTIALATGAWFDPQVVDGILMDVHGNPNVLTLDKGTSGLAQGNVAHTALVEIRRRTGTVPQITAFTPPEGTSNFG